MPYSVPLRRSAFLWALLALAFLACSCGPGGRVDDADERRPNIILILTDDQGIGDLSVTGHPYLETPNLDRLAREGTRFEQFYVNSPVCSPSRTAFMTGHYPARHRIHQHFGPLDWNRSQGMPNWLDPNTPMVTRLLQEAGYATGLFGKWHLGGKRDDQAPLPRAYGIDAHRTYASNDPGWPELSVAEFRARSADLFVDEAIRFIESNRQRPFYLNLWTRIPHARLQPTSQQLAVYDGIEPETADFDSYMREYLAQAPDLDGQMKTYCAAMTGMDAAIGRLLDTLDELDLADNTLVFFTSDNGPEDYVIEPARSSGVGSTGVFRGRKRSLYEGGIRMPCIARWPGKIPAGRVDAESVLTSVDWLPTAVAIAGAELPDFQPDGEDVSDILFGNSRPRARPIYWEWTGEVYGAASSKAPQLAIRDSKWKLFVEPDGGGAELYDVLADPQERTNVAESHLELVEELSSKLLAWKTTLPD